MANGSTQQTPVKVTIAYCAECGYDVQTLELAGALMREFQHRLSEIELVPWFEGSFDVSVNGKVVHSMYQDGGFPESETIARAVKEALGA